MTDEQIIEAWAESLPDDLTTWDLAAGGATTTFVIDGVEVTVSLLRQPRGFAARPMDQFWDRINAAVVQQVREQLDPRRKP